MPAIKAPAMALGGLTPLSTVDFPGGYLAAVLFAQGCPLRCPYCHNPGLQPWRGRNLIPWCDALRWLQSRRGLLDAVVFSGGEPTAQAQLTAALADVRRLGFRTALHTAGIYPARLREVLSLSLVDWVGLDIKAPWHRYDDITGLPGSGGRIQQTLDMILTSGVCYELRTTVHLSLVTAADLLVLARELKRRGVGRWVLQEFHHQGCPDKDLAATSLPLDASLLSQLRVLVPEIQVRS
ncbi:MAG: anaerobic ribonucleoside-triphosphate reductase activating protein [Phycisphaerae bacterium]